MRLLESYTPASCEKYARDDSNEGAEDVKEKVNGKKVAFECSGSAKWDKDVTDMIEKRV